ncbi:hypothetical protein [Sulfurivermis fontis]|jgi:hypothetical protein|uniref:hypothetical protein n=1 Tax=Sulfurivermis fontis TaxID=1972068 RepID=UPI000FDBFB09|nr:hypothetical protein [Sulfurivermis fontis]
MQDDERRLIAQVRAALDESVANLDAVTRSRLAQARARAQRPQRQRRYWWLPLGGAVLASLFAAMLWLGQPALLPGTAVDSATDFELLTASEDLELYQELDFYHWLAEEEPHAG